MALSVPLPWCVVLTLAAHLEKACRSMGLVTVLAADAYLRPAETLALTTRGLVAPVRGARHHP